MQPSHPSSASPAFAAQILFPSYHAGIPKGQPPIAIPDFY